MIYKPVLDFISQYSAFKLHYTEQSITSLIAIRRHLLSEVTSSPGRIDYENYISVVGSEQNSPKRYKCFNCKIKFIFRF